MLQIDSIQLDPVKGFRAQFKLISERTKCLLEKQANIHRRKQEGLYALRRPLIYACRVQTAHFTLLLD